MNLQSPVPRLPPIMNRMAERHESTSYSPTSARPPGVAAENAGRVARADCAVRVEREAQAEPEPALQAEAPDEAEIEL